MRTIRSFARSFGDRPAELVMLLVFAAGFAGCSAESTPVKLPPGATLEVFTIAAAKDANTTEAVDPATGGAIFLQTPPVITTADVATITRSAAEYGAANGESKEHPALLVELTPAGATKMATATANSIGEPMAVVINGQVVAMPKVMTPIRSSFQISGDALVTSAIEALTKP